MRTTIFGNLLRRLKESGAAVLVGVGFFLPLRSTGATESPPRESKTIQDRVELVREQLRQRGVQNDVQAAAAADGEIAQWQNWPNWNNTRGGVLPMPQWQNWNNMAPTPPWQNWNNMPPPPPWQNWNNIPPWQNWNNMAPH